MNKGTNGLKIAIITVVIVGTILILLGVYSWVSTPTETQGESKSEEVKEESTFKQGIKQVLQGDDTPYAEVEEIPLEELGVAYSKRVNIRDSGRFKFEIIANNKTNSLLAVVDDFEAVTQLVDETGKPLNFEETDLNELQNRFEYSETDYYTSILDIETNVEYLVSINFGARYSEYSIDAILPVK